MRAKGKASRRRSSSASRRPRVTLRRHCPSLLRDAGDDPIAQFDGIAEKVVPRRERRRARRQRRRPRSSPTANATTSSRAGLVHFTMLDVRRVMGTTDVESNAQASAPDALRTRPDARPSPAHLQEGRPRRPPRSDAERPRSRTPTSRSSKRAMRSKRSTKAGAVPNETGQHRHRHARPPSGAHRRARAHASSSASPRASRARCGATRSSARPKRTTVNQRRSASSRGA